MGQTGEGRAINRHDYTSREIDDALERAVVQRLLELVRLRKARPAFDGTLAVELIGRNRLRMSWQAASSSCSLDVDASSGRITIDQGKLGGAGEEPVG